MVDFVLLVLNTLRKRINKDPLCAFSPVPGDVLEIILQHYLGSMSWVELARSRAFKYMAKKYEDMGGGYEPMCAFASIPECETLFYMSIKKDPESARRLIREDKFTFPSSRTAYFLARSMPHHPNTHKGMDLFAKLSIKEGKTPWLTYSACRLFLPINLPAGYGNAMRFVSVCEHLSREECDTLFDHIVSHLDDRQRKAFIEQIIVWGRNLPETDIFSYLFHRTVLYFKNHYTGRKNLEHLAFLMRVFRRQTTPRNVFMLYQATGIQYSDHSLLSDQDKEWLCGLYSEKSVNVWNRREKYRRSIMAIKHLL